MDNEFIIPLNGLTAGENRFFWKAGKEFFEGYENTEVLDAQLDIEVSAEKSGRYIGVDCDIHGWLVVECDRCLEDLNMPIDVTVRLSVKFGEADSSEEIQAMNGEIMGDENVILAGKPVIRDVFGDLEFEISPASFYQVNPVQMKRLYDKVKEYCYNDYDGEKPVILDLYCGVGTIGLYCADMAEAVVGIETVKEAVIDANRNAVVNGIVNARYVTGKAEEILPKYVAFDPAEHPVAEGEETKKQEIDPKIAEQVKNANVAILDPPRAGCRPELLEAVAKVGVDKIVYVSCDPATLARDIKVLEDLGYVFIECTPVDMFPNSAHVETVVLLSRKKVNDRINFDINIEALPDRVSKTATYAEIKAYVLEHYGLKVSSLYIAQIKEKHGIKERENYNIGEGKSKELICPPEKEEAITNALKHFNMI